MSVPRLAEATRPAVILTSAATPKLLAAAAEALASRLENAEHRVGEADGPPHLAAPDEVAEAVLELAALGASRAGSLASAGPVFTSITPPRRPITAPPSSTAARRATGIAASTVTIASTANTRRPRPVEGFSRPDAASEAKLWWNVSRFRRVCHIEAIPAAGR